MKITTLSQIPPEITQSFSRGLLDPWGATVEILEKQYKNIVKKHKNNKGILKDSFVLYKLMEELDEWHKAQKAYECSENKIKAKKPDLQISKKPLFPHELRDELEKFVEFVRKL